MANDCGMIEWGEGEDDSWKDFAGHPYSRDALDLTDQIAATHGDDVACRVLDAYDKMGDAALEPSALAALLGHTDTTGPLTDLSPTPPEPEAFFVPGSLSAPAGQLALGLSIGPPPGSTN